MYDILNKIDATPETELERIFQHIIQKIEAFAKPIKLDPNTKDFLRRLVKQALMLYIMMEEKHGDLREADDSKEFIATLNKLLPSNVNKVEQTLYLARDISQEYLLATSIKIR